MNRSSSLPGARFASGGTSALFVSALRTDGVSLSAGYSLYWSEDYTAHRVDARFGWAF